MEKNCPCCDKHCPVEKLSCGQGRRHFGMEKEECPQERMISLLRRCGHFLHHSMGPGSDDAPLTEALSAEERATLEGLLEKCLNHWESLPMPRGERHGHPHRGLICAKKYILYGERMSGCQKRFLTTWWTGEQAPPPLPPLPVFA